jgi:hypothetical protein
MNSSIKPRPSGNTIIQNIFLDKGYDSIVARKWLSHEFILHIPERENRKKKKKV